MSCIVHIETATDVCSVALSEDGKVLMSKEHREGPNHNVVLAPFVDEAVSFADSHAIPIDAVAVSCGPGSYTGLRIGVSTAKGLCYGRDLKLVSVSTLELLCVPLLLYRDDLPDEALFCPMIDARRMEVYSAIYDRALGVRKPVSADIVEENTYAEYLDEAPVVFFGNGAAKCREVIQHPNAHFLDGIVPLAKHMLPLAERAVARQQWEDVAYFEPFYLKEFVATQPRKLFN
ncbi:MAG: tRNA (adenosine(37)-N6)-threonylcarbamoyltransferase complex dimerization subunit type 1 TsaB [Bacteroidaceae bacterium]|nr:tRNA (adenosine(37)-N6)-threonylcarbamoyltransferase complex dimerization subunit type 1 TsaB [Bacteroidaceae bacterium]